MCFAHRLRRGICISCVGIRFLLQDRWQRASASLLQDLLPLGGRCWPLRPPQQTSQNVHVTRRTTGRGGRPARSRKSHSVSGRSGLFFTCSPGDDKSWGLPLLVSLKGRSCVKCCATGSATPPLLWVDDYRAHARPVPPVAARKVVQDLSWQGAVDMPEWHSEMFHHFFADMPSLLKGLQPFRVSKLTSRA